MTHLFNTYETPATRDSPRPYSRLASSRRPLEPRLVASADDGSGPVASTGSDEHERGHAPRLPLLPDAAAAAIAATKRCGEGARLCSSAMSQQHERRGRWQAGRSRELVRLCEDGLGACLQVAWAGHGAAVGVEAHRAADALESGSVGGVLLLWRDEIAARHHGAPEAPDAAANVAAQACHAAASAHDVAMGV